MVDTIRTFAFLEKIAFNRPSGTPDERKAAEIIAEEIRAFGFEPTFEPFTFDDAETTGTLTVLEPYEKTYAVRPFAHCASTDPEGVTCPFVYADSIEDWNRDQLKGALCIFGTHCELEQVIKAGAAGFLCISGGKAVTRPEDIDFYRPDIRKKQDRDQIPALAITGPDAFDLIEKGAKKVRFTVTNRSYSAESQNVCATIPGTASPDRVIVIGAHYDSVPFGCGASDNAGGSATIMELFRHFAQNPPKKTIRFVWFGAEEVGLFGSKAYVKAHADELDSIDIMINCDVGGAAMGRNFVRGTCDESVAQYLKFLAAEVGYPGDIKKGCMGSDSSTFAFSKVPAVGFGRGEAECIAFAHSRNDIVRFLSPDRLAETTAFVLLFAEKMDKIRSIPFPREIPEDVMKRCTDIVGEL